MRNRVFFLLLLAILLSACAADDANERSAARKQAEESVAVIRDGDAIEVVDEKTGEKTVLVCRYERTTGTHTVRKVCQSREQRDAQAKAAQEQMRSLNRKGGFCSTPNCSN